MRPEEYELYVETPDPEKMPVLISSYTVGPVERTLVYGYDIDRNTVHVYLHDLEIHKVVYKSHFDYQNARRMETFEVLSHEHKALWEAQDLVPSKRAYPQHTDLGFALLMKSLGVPLTFGGYNNDPSRKPFHGHVPGLEEAVV